MWRSTLSVVVWTLGEMGVLPIANVVVADLAPARARGRYQGAYGLAFGSAVCVAPVLGMLTLERLGSTALWTGCLGIGLLVSAGHLTLSRVLARAREAECHRGRTGVLIEPRAAPPA